MAEPRRVQQEALVYERQGDSTVLRPAAQPVDTFVRQQAPTKSGLWDVAQSLAEVNPRINRWIDERSNQMNAEDARDAEAKAMVSSAATWQAAIDKGEVSAGASPLYQRVFEETIGKRDGLSKAQAEVWQAWIDPANTDRSSQDPVVIAGFFDKFKKKFFEGQTPDYVKGFAPAFFQVQQQLTQRIISENVSHMEQKGKDALGQLFMERIRAGRGKMSAEQIAAQLTDDSLPAQFAGLKGKDVNDIAAKALIAVAQTTGDSSVLQIGYANRPDLRNPGQSVKGVFTIPQYAVAADNAKLAILQKANANETRAAAAEARAERKAGMNFMVEMVQKKAADPNWEPSAEDLVRGQRFGVSPSIVRSQMGSVQKQVAPVDNRQLYLAASDYQRALNEGRDPDQAVQVLLPHLTPAQVIAYAKSSNDITLDKVMGGETYKNQKASFSQMVDRLTKSLDPVEAQNLVRNMLNELDGFTVQSYLSMSTEGKGVIDQRKLNDAIKIKADELVEKMRVANDPPANPGTPAAPLPPGAKQGQQQGAKANPNSVANAIPLDRIVPVNEAASGYQFPAPRRDIGNGRSVIMQWQPDNGMPTMQEINFLRMNPLKTNAEGAPFWRRFDEQYGVGASRFFVTNSPREINGLIDRTNAAQRKAGQQEFDDTMRRVRSAPPHQVP